MLEIKEHRIVFIELMILKDVKSQKLPIIHNFYKHKNYDL